jgi:ferrochelatase
MKKTAVVLFNLGGPDQLSSVKPFLFNLFNDKAIISLPQPFRFLLAKLISHKRASKAENIYKQIGNKSPIVDITNAQAESLAKELSFYGEYEVFVIMRYWHPLASDVVDKIKQYQPDNLVLLPLYPQFSSTTTASSFKDFLANFSADKCNIKTICCYPTDPYFIKSHSHLILAVLQKINSADLHKVRILFSAHGLPQKVIDRGDPYVYQVTKTVEQVVLHLQNMGYNNLDYSICYQSKVGPLKWTTPSLESEMHRLALDGKIAVVSPIAFVSDHSETLVELDIEYKQMAKELGISDYHRVSSLNLHSEFIKSLADLVINACNSNCQMFCGTSPTRICPKNFKLCPNHNSK